MTIFWIAAALLSALAALPILLGAARGARTAAANEDPTLALHQRQLAEIDDLAARGLISENEHASARAEAGRRLLSAADAKPPVAADSSGFTRKLAVAGAIAAPLIGVAIYIAVGSPSIPDQPFSRRLAAWGAAAKSGDVNALRPDEMVAVLEAIGRERPTDPEAPAYQAGLLLGQGDAAGAATALRRAVRIAPERADLWSRLGETLVIEAENQVSDDAVIAFQQALKRQPDMPAPRYYLARRQIADGQVTEGLAAWRTLYSQLADGPNRAALEGEINAVAATGRLPNDQEQAATGQPQVGPEQIAAMVAGLAERLKAQPDDPQGWVRLVRAYTVMGDTAKRDAALAEARARYKNDPDVLRGLDSAAQKPQ